MAHKVIVTPTVQGHHSVVHVYIESDGASADLVDQVLIDPVADLKLKSSARPVVEGVCHSFVGFDARLEFDSGLVDDNMIWVLSSQSAGEVDFVPYSGLKDLSGLDGTGKLQITTSGLSSAGSMGSMFIRLRNA